MSQAFTSKGRLSLVVVTVFFAFGILIARLLFLHVFDSARLQGFAEDVRKSTRVIPSERGAIFDRGGNILAATHSTYTVGVDPNFLKSSERKKWPHLAFILEVPYADLVSVMERKYRAESGRMIRWAPLAKNVDLKTYAAVMDLGITGVYGNRKNQRVYPGKQLAAHMIGYINHESKAVTGIEHMCDYYLRGQDGWVESEKDGRRRELAHKRSREIAPINGNDVFLTLDQHIQSAVEAEIERLVDRYQPEGISVIVSRPKDGAILALANYPTYDLNAFYNTHLYPIAHQRNRAISDILEPGSTFKIVPASAVLNESIVDIEEVFETGEAYALYQNRKVRLPSDHKRFDQLSMREIVVKSSNRGAAHLGMRLGDQRLYDYAASFGFGSRTELGLHGEVSGTLSSVDQWDGLTIASLPMGHAVAGTPLQIHYAMSVIANQGILMKPKIIERICDAEGATVLTYPAVHKHRVIDASVAEQMAYLLNQVVRSGTAKRAHIEGYSVAGKTGTTRKLINGRYSERSHIASFSGFLPAENPELVITVIVDEPKMKAGSGYGGVVAAPAFKTIAEDCIRYLGIRPSQYSQDWIAKRKFLP